MKDSTKIAVLVGALILFGVASASAQVWGRPPVPSAGACFYEDVNFGGQYFCSPAGASTAFQATASKPG